MRRKVLWVVVVYRWLIEVTVFRGDRRNIGTFVSSPFMITDRGFRLIRQI